MPRDYRVPGNVILNSGFCGCDDRFALLEEDTIPRRLADSDIPEVRSNYKSNGKMYVYVDNDGKDAKVSLDSILYPSHVNADWNATRGNDSEGYYYNPAYIYNKPDFEGFEKDVDRRMKGFEEGLCLDEDFKVTNTVGKVKAGTTLLKGTPLQQIIKDMLTKGVGTVLKYGVIDDPGRIEALEYEENLSVQKLLDDGLTISDLVLDGEYHVVAIPEDAGIKCTKVFQGGHAIDLTEGLVEEIIDGMRVYHLDMPTIGTYNRCKYIFEEV